jgi:transmembrane E3 ubiquitin-protein ligase
MTISYAVMLQDDSMTCPMLLFGQIHPSSIPQEEMLELEEEYRKPTGIHTVTPPKLEVDILLLSKECGILYEMKNLEGTRSGAFFRQVTTCK